jgi:predicted transcriptional regulator of viral defense system
MGDEGCIDHAIGGKCIPRDVDRVAGKLAARQHGVVSRRQLILLGVGPRTVEERVKRGAWHRVHVGVYAVGHSGLNEEGRWMAAVLACGCEAVLSHRSAGRCWSMLAHAPALPEVTRPSRFRARPGIVARRSALPLDEVAIVDGIPVTSVSRTLLDLAVLTRPQMERALNEAEVRRLTDELSVPDLLERYPRRRGSPSAQCAPRGPRPVLRGRLPLD